MKGVVIFILNTVAVCLISVLLNLQFIKKRRYQKLKVLNAELDILLKAAALKEKNIQVPEHIQLFIKQLYKR